MNKIKASKITDITIFFKIVDFINLYLIIYNKIHQFLDDRASIKADFHHSSSIRDFTNALIFTANTVWTITIAFFKITRCDLL